MKIFALMIEDRESIYRIRKFDTWLGRESNAHVQKVPVNKRQSAATLMRKHTLRGSQGCYRCFREP